MNKRKDFVTSLHKILRSKNKLTIFFLFKSGGIYNPRFFFKSFRAFTNGGLFLDKRPISFGAAKLAKFSRSKLWVEDTRRRVFPNLPPTRKLGT